MEYIAYVQELELSHWLIIAGAGIVLFGIVGLGIRRVKARRL